jgi:hypothetical protein
MAIGAVVVRRPPASMARTMKKFVPEGIHWSVA